MSITPRIFSLADLATLARLVAESESKLERAAADGLCSGEAQLWAAELSEEVEAVAAVAILLAMPLGSPEPDERKPSPLLVRAELMLQSDEALRDADGIPVTILGEPVDPSDDIPF